MIKELNMPIFFIGAPRSGTTVVFEAFARHPDLAWLTNYMERVTWFRIPDLAVRYLKTKHYDYTGQKKQYSRTTVLNRILPKPGECYQVWNKNTEVDFARSFLIGETAQAADVARIRKLFGRVQRIQGKGRLATKITGPSRLGYLNSVFPDAYFINIVRDGRAVVDSLMRVPFWQEKKLTPWWNGGLTEEDVEVWEQSNKNPVILTALLWRRIVEVTEAEKSNISSAENRCMDVKYENFIADPRTTLECIFSFCSLNSSSPVLERCLADVSIYKSFNTKFYDNMSVEIRGQIEQLLHEQLERYGYI